MEHTRLLLAVAVLATAVIGAAPTGAGDDGFHVIYFPQPDPATRFGDDFGGARVGHQHQGIDLLGAKLMPVVAVADGFVEAIETGTTSGNYVRIRHADGWETWYLHLNDDTPLTDDGAVGPEGAVLDDIRVGAFVSGGQQIGWAGDSGNAEWTTPHTHFELHHRDQVVNPYPYLLRAWQVQLRMWEFPQLLG